MGDFDVLAELVPLSGRTVVDVGCGDGAFVRRLRAAGADALGVDIDVARAWEADPDGRYLTGGAEALPLDDASVDVAVLMRSLHHVPDPDAAFPELRRVVRDLVYVAEPLPTGSFFELMLPVDDETEVRAAAQAAIAARRRLRADLERRVRRGIRLAAFEDFRAHGAGRRPRPGGALRGGRGRAAREVPARHLRRADARRPPEGG